jgi:uncharacterized protein (TIGR00303 family)
MISSYIDSENAIAWRRRQEDRLPVFACIFGFTATGSIPGISAAGLTPEDRRYTALADAEFLLRGRREDNIYPLPPLTAGASPAYITRAILQKLAIPTYLFDAGLPIVSQLPLISLGGMAADCITTGKAMPMAIVRKLFAAGWEWGERITTEWKDRYLTIGECVVGGTTTAASVLAGLGIDCWDCVSSSHVGGNREQKRTIVNTAIAKLTSPSPSPWETIAAIGDPMQIAVAGMGLAASRHTHVLLAGGTQMLAVYALTKAIALSEGLDWYPQHFAVGTTRWVATDASADAVKLARSLDDAILLASQLSFADSQYEAFRVYEAGFVKEGVGAGGCAIAATLSYNWTQDDLLQAIESEYARYLPNE